MPNVAIFASGSGTNAENLIKIFKNSSFSVVSIFCNNENAGVINRAQENNIPVCIFSKSDFNDTELVYNELRNKKVDFIILAGFLLLIPPKLIRMYDKRIINIHPALLPNYGGKGMYGMNIHRAVVENKESKTGITIHLVDEIYDNGKILFQASCDIFANDTPETVAQKVQELEYKHFPQVIQEYIHNYR